MTNRLSEDVLNDTNSIENIVCKKMDGLKRHPMNEEDTELFTILLLSQAIDMDSMSKEEKDEMPFLVKLIISRVEHSFTVEMDSKVILMIAQLSKVAGKAVTYLTYIQYLCKQRDIRKLDFNTFCTLFPDGFFSDSDLNDVWDSQKVNTKKASNNLLDYATPSKSIQFEI